MKAIQRNEHRTYMIKTKKCFNKFSSRYFKKKKNDQRKFQEEIISVFSLISTTPYEKIFYVIFSLFSQFFCVFSKNKSQVFGSIFYITVHKCLLLFKLDYCASIIFIFLDYYYLLLYVNVFFHFPRSYHSN